MHQSSLVHILRTGKMHSTSCCTLLTVLDSINSAGTRTLHLLPWLPSASFLFTFPFCSSTLRLHLLLKADPCCHADV